jgi:hypothetical protein
MQLKLQCVKYYDPRSFFLQYRPIFDVQTQQTINSVVDMYRAQYHTAS